MRLDETTDSLDKRMQWKVVRRDDFTDVPGVIMVADEDSGMCKMKIGDENKVLDFGPNGIRLVGRSR